MSLNWTPSRWSKSTQYAIVDTGFYATRPHWGRFGDRWSAVYYPDEWDGLADTCRMLLGQEHLTLDAAQAAAESHWNKTKLL